MSGVRRLTITSVTVHSDDKKQINSRMKEQKKWEKKKISALSLFFEFNSEQQILLLQLCRCTMMREHSKMRAVLGAATIFIKFY